MIGIWGRRYLIAEGEGRLYVAFMGTKQRRDLVANANILQEPVWPELVDTNDDDDFQTNVYSLLSFSHSLSGCPFPCQVALCQAPIGEVEGGFFG